MKSQRFRIGCSGWYYWHWKGEVYPADLPASRWFAHYQRAFDTVELNAPFYHWPRLTTVRNWARQAGPGFQYSVKVNRAITHLKRFSRTKQQVRQFCGFADVLGDHMGCFLFQLPPSFRYTPARLRAIVGQLDPRHRNAVEFRHASWWNQTVFGTFRDAGLILCCVSAPRLPDEVVRTADAIYVRFHGAKQWYRHDYSDAELKAWAGKIRASRAKEVWACFNNDFQGCAFRNAQTLRRLLG
jgi:uncharacterized protein YecE (DUF72 family)